VVEEPEVRLSWRQRCLGPAIAGAVAAAVWAGASGDFTRTLILVAAATGLAAGAVSDFVVYALRRDRPATGLGALAWAALAPLLLYSSGLAAWFVTAASGRGPWLGLSGALVLGGTSGLVWGSIWRVAVVGNRARRLSKAAAIAIAAAMTVGVGLWPRGGVWRGHYEARAMSCRSNLDLIARGILLYADDYDGRLPPPVSSLDLAGVHYERFPEARRQPFVFGMAVLGDGLLWPYTRNASIWHCPADPSFRDAWGRPRTDYLPEPGLSYRWNAGLAGRVVSEMKNAQTTPLIFDRLPFHRGKRNAAFLDGRVGTVPENEWRQADGR
jgi:prepilin-type processing-associated H-X9-DG protein